MFGIELAAIATVLSIALVWASSPVIWKASYVLTLMIALAMLSISAVAIVAIIALIALLTIYTFHETYRGASVIGLLVLGVLLSLHVVPGFNNQQYLAGIQLNEQSAAFSIWFNYDKSLLGVLVLGVIFHPTLIRSWNELLVTSKQLLPIILVGLPLVYLLGITLNYSKFDWTPTMLFFPWALKNLFFTVLAEEIMFRGLIQKELMQRIQSKHAANISIGVGAVLFGAAHFAGGIGYVFLSTVAGCVYGYAYKVTGKIEAAIATHFLLNAGHFLFFSYPYLIS